MAEKVIIVGANHAGTAAANQILASGKDIELTIYDRNSNISFLGCGMALWIGNQISTGDGLFYNSAEKLRAQGAKVHMETEILQVNYAEKKLKFRTKEGTEGEDHFDKLILATGSRPILPPIKGRDLKNVQVAKLYQDACRAIAAMDDPSIKHVTVVGAGYIGVELAEAFKRRGREVCLIDALDQILGTHFDVDFSDKMKDRLLRNGIRVELGTRLEEIQGEDRVTGIKTDKGEIKTDMVLLCIGFRPNTDLAGEALERGAAGAIRVNRHQETSVAGVYAIGDCATIYNNAIRGEDYIALATNAVRSGIVAALNVLGTPAESLGVQGSSALCIYNLKMVSTGLSLQSAARHGIEVEHSDFTDLQKPAFMNEHEVNPEVKIRIVYRKDDHVVVGAQLQSEYDMSGVIHLFSLAIQEQVTVEKIALLDIFFMPHFNQPYNYITMAAISAK